MSMPSTGLGHHETPRMQTRVYTIEQVGTMLGLSRNSAYSAARDGTLPVAVIKIGRRLMVSKAALDKFLGIEEEAA
jgi:predicted DNA-binding transcriptional regulator AlpA